MHAWNRHVTAIEDDYLREVALGGPDTCSRIQTMWQVKLKYLDPNAAEPIEITAQTDYDSFLNWVNPTGDAKQATLVAQAKKPATESGLCIVSPERSLLWY